MAVVFAAAASELGAMPALKPAPRAFSEDFQGSRLDARRWTHWWGLVAVERSSAVLASAPPTSARETYSSLVTTRRSWRDFQLDLGVGTIEQLRRGSSPNPWETAWVMFRFRGLHDYYYFILKPNGWELGKKQGSDAQIYLATGSSPTLAIGEVAHLRITAIGPRIEVLVDGVEVLEFTDPRPLPGGAIGLYEEDAVARFSALRVLRARAPSGG